MAHDEYHIQCRRDTLSKALWFTDVMRQDMQKGLEQRGMTQVRAHLLWELAIHQPMMQGELAKVLGVTPRNVTTLIDALERAGFVLRSAHPTDRRATMLSLSETGTAEVARLQNDMTELADMLFANVSPAELEIVSRVIGEAALRLSTSLGK